MATTLPSNANKEILYFSHMQWPLIVAGGNDGQGQLLATLKSWTLTLSSGTPRVPYYPIYHIKHFSHKPLTQS